MYDFATDRLVLEDAAFAAHRAELHRLSGDRIANHRSPHHPAGEKPSVRQLAARLLANLAQRLDPAIAKMCQQSRVAPVTGCAPCHG